MSSPRVLSIQSHVVRGYVGNKSATFPLQVLGFEVDAINSVQLSNHTGYKTAKGQILNEQDLGVLFDALEANDLLQYTHLLTGYVGSPSFLKKIAQVVAQLKAKNPDLIYVCDPVMGDNGKMYVPESLLSIYKESIIPLADIITPNHYELELLSGRSINNLNDAWNAIDIFHEMGCETVIISSSTLGKKGELLALASTKKGTSDRVTISIPQLENVFTGTGDLFAALFLAWMHKTNDNVRLAIENSMYSLQEVLKRTIKVALERSKGSAPTIDLLELQLIQSKNDIENPQPSIRCDSALAAAR